MDHVDNATQNVVMDKIKVFSCPDLSKRTDVQTRSFVWIEPLVGIRNTINHVMGVVEKLKRMI